MVLLPYSILNSFRQSLYRSHKRFLESAFTLLCRSLYKILVLSQLYEKVHGSGPQAWKSFVGSFVRHNLHNGYSIIAVSKIFGYICTSLWFFPFCVKSGTLEWISLWYHASVFRIGSITLSTVLLLIIWIYFFLDLSSHELIIFFYISQKMKTNFWILIFSVILFSLFSWSSYYHFIFVNFATKLLFLFHLFSWGRLSTHKFSRFPLLNLMLYSFF